MKRSIETYKGEYFFRDTLLLYINRSTEDFHVALHDHDFLEIAYVAEGSGFHYLQNEVHKVHKGQLFFIPIGISHVFRPPSSDTAKHPLIVYNCVISPLLLSKIADFSTDLKVAEYIQHLKSGDVAYFSYTDAGDRAEKLFLSMHREYTLSQSGSSDYLYALLLQLLIVIYRFKQDSKELPEPKPTPFAHLLSYMDQNSHTELSLAHLSQISRWSERHLQRLFKQHTGQTFNACLQSLRIQKSCELLRSSQQKISSISETVGYKDLDSFNSVFKRITGMTPSQYRKELSVLL
ncbi:helix-turn-helix domain-containing protein [Cohnella sp.]|uniref:helix-turn-helix domain-containing protein n=1 Tax=Cohnella sp. TaxID=1883426 RepID=UPI003563BBEE